MKEKHNILLTLLVGAAVGLLIISCRDKKHKIKEQKEQDVTFDTTELTSSYHYMHSEIKRK
jgi:hypothetical protein